MVSFDPKLHTQFEEVKKSGRSVALQNCFVKRSRFETDNFEIHVNNKSSIVSSPKKFKVSEDALTTSCCPELGTIEELKDLTEHQQLNVTGKIQSISVVEQLVKKGTGKQLSKQDFVIVDGTGACRGVAWEQHLGKLKVDSCYKIINATVRSFNGSKYISLGERSLLQDVEDIGYVVDESPFDGSGGITVMKAEIIAVIKIEAYASCRNCNGKVIQVGGIGECSKCSAKMKIGKWKNKNVARVILEDGEEKEHKLTIFDEVLQQIANLGGGTGANVDITEQLLSSPKLNYTIKGNETVSAVSRILDA